MTYPTIRPEIIMDFANSRQLDPRINFSRPQDTGMTSYINADTGMISYAYAHQPRFEKDGLLIEEARTNQITSSTDLGNIGTGGWYTDSNKGGVNQAAGKNFFVVEANTPDTRAPDGTQTATKLSPPSTIVSPQPTPQLGALQYPIHIVSKVVTTGTNTGCSFFVKDPNNFADGLDKIGIFVGGFYNSRKGIGSFDLVNNDTNYTNSDIGTPNIEPLANGWYRISFVATEPGVFAFVAWNGLDTDLYIWGAQCEEGPSVSSFIPTSGTALNRAPDIAQITGDNFSSWYNQSEGTVLLKATTLTTDPKTFFYICDASSAASDRISHDTNSLKINSGGTAIINRTISAYYPYNSAIAYKANNFATSERGVVQTVSSGAVPSNVDIAYFYHPVYSQSHPSYHISRLAYYSQKLTDEQLELITL